MPKTTQDRRLTLTAAVRASVIAQASELARKRGVPVSRIVDEILAAYFERLERAAKRGKSGRVVTVTSESQLEE
jgi:post-segregation antitoxin (ccd killing protein)